MGPSAAMEMERANKRKRTEVGMPPLELMEELVEEVLLRFPPDDPASLVRAALVCKLWRRLVCNTAFHHRFREFHRSRAPPLLGVVCTGHCKCKLRHDDTPAGAGEQTADEVDPPVKPAARVVMPVSTPYLVPTTSFHPHPPAAHAVDQGRRRRHGWRAIDARHGRVLLSRLSYPTWPRRQHRFSVWDPVTDEQRDLPELPSKMTTRHHRYCAAVACAAADNDCNHLHCHRGHFLVVVMDMTQPLATYLSVYSSQVGAWSQPADFERPSASPNLPGFFVAHAPSVLVGTALYFLVHSNHEIVKYDMATREVSNIHLPSRFHHLLKQRSIVLMTTTDNDDHGLGFVASIAMDYQLELWSMVPAAGGGDFVLTRVIDLVRLLPGRALLNNPPQVIGFADVGASRFLFMRTPDGLYSMHINSSSSNHQVKKIANCCDPDKFVLPYVSFCTPTSSRDDQAVQNDHVLLGHQHAS